MKGIFKNSLNTLSEMLTILNKEMHNNTIMRKMLTNFDFMNARLHKFRYNNFKIMIHDYRT